jgi:hypothetical protein
VPWPAPPDVVMGAEHGDFEDAAPGYSIVACELPREGVGDSGDYVWRNTQQIVIEEFCDCWGKLDAILRHGGGFKWSDEAGDHLRGYVYPDGRVAVSAGVFLKGMDWWPVAVRAAMRATEAKPTFQIPVQALAGY